MLDTIASPDAETRRLPGHLDDRPFIALLQDDDQQREAALSRLLSDFAQPDVRVVRMGNSMRSRLMLEHILIKVAGPDGSMSQDDGPRRIARIIAERQGQETRVVLLITQAETLHSKTLRLLHAMRPYFAEAGAPTLQVVFVGRQAFWTLLDARGMAPLREALGLQAQADAMPPATSSRAAPSETDPNPHPIAQSETKTPTPADPAPETGMLRGKAGHPGPALTAMPRRTVEAGTSRPVLRRGRNLALGLAVFAAMALAAYMGLHAAFYREVPARAVLSMPRPNGPPPVAASADSPVPGPPAQDMQAALPGPGPAPPGRTSPPDPGRSRGMPLTTQRSPESMESSGRPPSVVAPPPLAAAPASPRIVIHVPTGSEGAEAMSAHLQAGLGSRLGTVEARRVAGTPDRPSIRYFHPGDVMVAQQVAARMAGAGLVWTLQDFSAFTPRPSRGTIEVWLPRL